MSKDPAFLFYPSDFLTGTFFFSLEDLGLYIRLLCIQHQHNGRINKGEFNEIVNEKHRKVREKFIEDDAGFYNLRLEKEILKRKRDADSSRENGKKGGRPKTQTKPKQNPQVSERKPKHNLTENENINININKDIDINAKAKKSENSNFQNCMKIYSDFIQKKTGVKAKITGADGKAMKDIISYLTSIVTDKADPKGVENALEYIFTNWEKAEPFLRNQLKLIQINSNLINIINQIKNGQSKPTNKAEQVSQHNRDQLRRILDGTL